MANGLLAMEGDIPEYIRKAAQKALDARVTPKSMAYEGIMRPSVNKAAQNALANKAADASFKMGPTAVVKGLLSKEGAQYLAEKAAQDARFAAPVEAAKVGAKGLAKGALGPLAAAYEGGSKLYESNLNPEVFSRSLDRAKADQFVYGDTATEFPGDRVKTSEAVSAEGFGKGITDRAVGAAKGAVQQGAAQFQSEAAQGKHPIFQGLPPEASQAKEVETKRQVVEQGAKNQLAQGQLSRPKAAEAVVKADFAKQGIEPTPQEFKSKVAEEAVAMKTMDNDQLSKYLSYALIAGGLVASALDKSGGAGNAFAGSFNSQLDRGQQEKMFKYKQDAAAKAAADAGILAGRKMDLQERDINSKVEGRTATSARDDIKTAGLLDKWENEQKNAQAKLAAYTARTAATGADGAAKEARAPKGSPMPLKDNKSIVDSYFKAKGVQLGDGVSDSMASEMRFLQKERPGASTEQVMNYLQKKYAQGQTDPLWGDPKTTLVIK
jgi:formaldehyde-activating enzyme involved in methanogenesis